MAETLDINIVSNTIIYAQDIVQYINTKFNSHIEIIDIKSIVRLDGFSEIKN